MWKTSVVCLHYRPETIHCSTKNAYTSEITFLALVPWGTVIFTCKHSEQQHFVNTVNCNCLHCLTQCTAMFTCVNNNKVSESDKASGLGRGIRRHLKSVENKGTVSVLSSAPPLHPKMTMSDSQRYPSKLCPIKYEFYIC